jgi:hypothetical protein
MTSSLEGMRAIVIALRFAQPLILGTTIGHIRTWDRPHDSVINPDRPSSLVGSKKT